ncbi:MAG: SAM-dependent DNA methyltransferase [Limisphaerales bacterium]
MSSLPRELRNQLQRAVLDARSVAETGARKALEALAVHEADAYDHLSPAQRQLRRQLRAQARQLGDTEDTQRRGRYRITHLAEKVAYDHWHRLLFARFLAENHLLISPEHGVNVTFADCEELAPALGLPNGWEVAARFAAVMLPEIFRADDPAGQVVFAPEDQAALRALVTGLPVAIFTARDALGWTYQFWQAERKDRVNESGVKIGADELPSVTQLFTEDYMVDFLLDNTLGAWWAGRKVISNQLSVISCPTEADARKAVALPGCEWKYLRFVRSDASPSELNTEHCLLNTSPTWTPAAGTFEGWPKSAAALRALDPCMGSGHFVVAMFERLVALRVAEEGLDEAAAVAAVIRDNLFGLEIDPRCTQIAAFNLALAAWRRVGHCKLPVMHLACSGLAPNAMKEDWQKLANGNADLRFAMGALYDLFQKAPVLGSLINPRRDKAVTYAATLHELQPLLEKALEREKTEETHELAVTAQGVAKAAEILAGQFTLVATNVPYLGSGKQDGMLVGYCERVHPEAFEDLATCFIDRALEFCSPTGAVALVTPQNWLFLRSFRHLRKSLLKNRSWNCVARLGEHGFESLQAAGAFTALVTLSSGSPEAGHCFVGIDAARESTPISKALRIAQAELSSSNQAQQALNPDSIIQLGLSATIKRVSDYAIVRGGTTTGDSPLFRRYFWEVNTQDTSWTFQQGTVDETVPYGGRELVLRWENGKGEIVARTRGKGATIAGREVWGRYGIAISKMRELRVTLYSGEVFENVAFILVPLESGNLSALWAFCSSPAFNEAVREVNQALCVDPGYYEKAPFDLAHWQQVAAEKYPHGLPKPFSSDPTQWLFNGHPAQELNHEATKDTKKPGTEPVAAASSPFVPLVPSWLKTSLHVAVARLLGYQWPRQTGSSFPDCPALGPDGLEKLADADGIVCLSAIKGEEPAAERLRTLLAQALGRHDLGALLASAGPKGSRSKTLEDWLRDEFFEQHCELFHQRPFLWHLWDGQRGGFAALVNYHQLTRANLEKLTFSYLGDWLTRQQAAVAAGEPGSDARLLAAQALQAELKLILAGEPPHDLFVRWKPLAQQPLGWDPDLNDGVRLNLRPFLLARDVGKKGAGLLRAKPGVKWDKDRGKEPQRDKKDFPWFWSWDEQTQDFKGGSPFDGNRWNACHYTTEAKRKAREGRK